MSGGSLMIRGRATPRVAVVGDDAAVASPTAKAAAAALRRAGLHAVPVAGLSTVAEARIEGSEFIGGAGIGAWQAVYLVGPPGRSGASRWVPDLGIPVVTEAQVEAVALVARLLLKLGHARLQRRSSRVLVLGDADNPEVGDLVVAAGVAEVVRWNPEDATGYPLPALARRVDVVLDVVGAPEHRRAAMAMILPPTLITLQDAVCAAALEDLLRGVLGADPPRVTRELMGHSAHRLASLVPAGPPLPEARGGI